MLTVFQFLELTLLSENNGFYVDEDDDDKDNDDDNTDDDDYFVKYCLYMTFKHRTAALSFSSWSEWKCMCTFDNNSWHTKHYTCLFTSCTACLSIKMFYYEFYRLANFVIRECVLWGFDSNDDDEHNAYYDEDDY